MVRREIARFELGGNMHGPSDIGLRECPLRQALGPGFGQGHLRIVAKADYAAVGSPLHNPCTAVLSNPYTKGRGGRIKVLSNRQRFDRHFSERF